MLHQTESQGEQVILGGNGALVASKSQPGFWHAVRNNQCDCLGFAHYHHCRHVAAVLALTAKTEEVKPVVERTSDTAPLAGPAIDPPLFTERKPWSPPKSSKTFEELFGYSA